MSLINKTNVRNISLGEPVDPSTANRPHSDLEANIDAIIGAVNNSIGAKVSTSSNYVAKPNERIIVDTSGSAITITLPNTANLGDYVVIADSGDAFTNNITILRNGNNIDSITDNFAIDIKGYVIHLEFVGGTIGWGIG